MNGLICSMVNHSGIIVFLFVLIFTFSALLKVPMVVAAERIAASKYNWPGNVRELMVVASERIAASKAAHVDENAVIIIRSQQIAAYNEAISGFEEGCKEKNIFIKAIYDLKGDTEEAKKVVQAIKGGKPKPKLILAVGVLAATLAKDQFPDIPMIFCMVINHERFNLHGTNITGISSEASLEDQFALLKEILGLRKNVGVLYDSKKTGKIISDATNVAGKFGINLFKIEVLSEYEVLSALKNNINKIDALWIVPDGTVITKDSIEDIVNKTSKNRLPTVSTSSAIVKAGALISISPDYAYTGRQAAQMVQTLLNDPTKTSLGVKRPDKLQITLNTQTAKMIGIKLSVFKAFPDIVLFP